jgi:hypothetical protein
MSLLLNVPFTEKDEVKRLGALWNPELKKWYVKYQKDYWKFKKWISNSKSYYILFDYIYIIEGINYCFKCNNLTRVICFGIEKYMEFNSEYEYGYDYFNDNNIHIAPHIYPIPPILLNYIQHKYNYKLKYSKSADKSYLANCCDNCDVLQGDFYLFDEPDSPFWIESPLDTSKLNIIKMPLKYDLVINNADIRYCSTDYLIKKYANIRKSSIELYNF